MPLPARIVSAILLVTAFALQASAQAVGTIQLQLTQTIDSNALARSPDGSFCTNTEIVDRQQRKFKEYWSDAFTSAAQPDDLTEAWQTYLAATYHLTRTPGSVNGAQVSGGCGETNVNFVTNWKRQSKQSWDQNTKINQQRVGLERLQERGAQRRLQPVGNSQVDFKACASR